MKLKKLVVLPLVVATLVCGTMTGCGKNAVESDLSSSTLKTAAAKLKGTWKTKSWSASNSKTKMVIDVKSNGEVPVKLTSVFLNRKFLTDSEAYIETFDKCKNTSGGWEYGATLCYHDGYVLCSNTLLCNKAMNKIKIGIADYKKQ